MARTPGSDSTAWKPPSREAYSAQAKIFDGPSLALKDVPAFCAFARFCDPHDQVWRQVEQSDQPAVRASFIRQVANCPPVRLVAWDTGSDKAVEPVPESPAW